MVDSADLYASRQKIGATGWHFCWKSVNLRGKTLRSQEIDSNRALILVRVLAKVIAGAIHNLCSLSQCNSRALVEVNCAVMPSIEVPQHDLG
jgi:hypothetical protein